MNKNLNALVNLLVKNNPNIANNPQAKEWLEVIKSGDAKRGQQIAENLCRNNGMTKEEGYESAAEWAKQFFGGNS